jgi:uncharacterized membrane-anchored protein
VRTKWIILIAALQVLVLAYMAGEREWVLHTGRTIYLRSAPMDPRDAMRGDYVRVSYDMSSVPRGLCRGSLASTNRSSEAVRPDTRVYAILRTNEDGVAEFVSLSGERPSDGLFVRGRTERSWGDHLQVRYGLEALFVQQGKGRELGPSLDWESVRVPLEIKAAVRRDGLAVINGHRRCALGIGLQLDTKEQPGAGTRRQRQAVGATVRLFNASSNDLAVVDLPEGGSLALVSVRSWGETHWRWVNEAQAQPVPQASQVVVLKPGESRSIKVSFLDPQWSVLLEAKGRPAGQGPVRFADVKENLFDPFRLEYRPPDRAACANLPNAGLIWHGRLASRAFNPSGSVE